MSNSITKQQVKDVLRLKNDQDRTFEEIGKILGVSRSTAARRYRANIEVDDTLEDFPPVPVETIKIKGHFVPEDKIDISRFKPLVCTGDAILTADFHIPLHDPTLINSMITCARRNKIKRLIIAGDYFNMDEFSSYPPIQPEATIDIEKRDGNVVMKTLCKTFDEIYFTWGNHDFRLTKKLGFKKSFDECIKWMLCELTEEEWSKVKVSELDHMSYFPQENAREIRICHPKNYSDVPLAVGKKLAIKYNTGVATAHSHHCALGVAPNGIDILMELGGFFDKNRTEYIQRTTDNHEWVQGFFLFRDGLPTMISPALGNDKSFRKEVK